jgi:predicted phosphodiesterase
MGDTGSGASVQYKVSSSIKIHCEKHKNCEAVFIVGDVIYENGVRSVDDEQFKTKFELPYNDISLPFYITLGNHDYRGCVECYLQYSETSEKWNISYYYYTKSFNDAVTFFFIDTESFDNKQQNWLEKELENDQSRFKIVLGHRPLITYESTKIDEYWNGKNELKDIICDKADFYIAGHSHLLEYPGEIEKCNVQQLVSGSGGSGVRKIKKPYKGIFFEEDNGFLSLLIKDKHLSFSFINKNGDILFQKQHN